VDWCLRRGDFKLGYAHDSVVHHIHGATAGASSTHKATRSRFNVYMTGRNRILIARKQFGSKWPVQIPITPKKRPTAASEKATGKPISMKTIMPPNINGGSTPWESSIS